MEVIPSKIQAQKLYESFADRAQLLPTTSEEAARTIPLCLWQLLAQCSSLLFRKLFDLKGVFQMAAWTCLSLQFAVDLNPAFFEVLRRCNSLTLGESMWEHLWSLSHVSPCLHIPINTPFDWMNIKLDQVPAVLKWANFAGVWGFDIGKISLFLKVVTRRHSGNQSWWSLIPNTSSMNFTQLKKPPYLVDVPMISHDVLIHDPMVFTEFSHVSP